MTKMSSAALPPRQPPVSEKDRQHPLFVLYSQHRSWCSSQLIEAPSFEDWFYQREQEMLRKSKTDDPRYPEFLEWMRENQGGARQCPAGNFPDNFDYWLNGGRW